MSKPFALILYGATSFVGKLTAEYLHQRHGSGGDLKWAIAGRSKSKLAQLQTELDADLPVVVADSADAASLTAMVRQANVILSTVGPYMQYGRELVAACVREGVDYLDLTGEVPFVRQMMDAHATDANTSGARIIHCAGFDSIPSDLGVFFINAAAQERFGESVVKVDTHVESFAGGFSGGTVASMMGLVKGAKEDSTIDAFMKDPYAVCPQGMRSGPQQPDQERTFYDPDLKTWVAPFIMAAVNTRVVLATNALLNYPYTKDFVYAERMAMSNAMAAYGVTAGLGLLQAGLGSAVGRTVLGAVALPKPGQGPSPRAQAAGHFSFRIHAQTAGGKRLTAVVTGDRDPGYGSTSKQFAEAGLCLLQDISRSKVSGGFWTPAAALGSALIERLTKHAGLTFDIVESD